MDLSVVPLIAGFAGGVVSTTLLLPLDVVKVPHAELLSCRTFCGGFLLGRFELTVKSVLLSHCSTSFVRFVCR